MCVCVFVYVYRKRRFTSISNHYICMSNFENSRICIESDLQFYREGISDVVIYRHKREAGPESSPCALDKYRDWIVQQTGTEVNARNRRVSHVTYINVNQLFFATTYFCDSFLINLCNNLYFNCTRYYTIL